jgi:protein-tyrosine-phosphatase
MAKVIAEKIFEEKNINYCVDSCSVDLYPPMSATENAHRAVNDLYNLSLENHISKSIDESIINSSDLILTMTKIHKKLILERFDLISDDNIYINKINTIVNFVDNSVCYDIVDPYGCDLEIYKDCAKQLFKLINDLAFKISKI